MVTYFAEALCMAARIQSAVTAAATRPRAMAATAKQGQVAAAAIVYSGLQAPNEQLLSLEVELCTLCYLCTSPLSTWRLGKCLIGRGNDTCERDVQWEVWYHHFLSG
jgi:hypothetical protein